MLLRRAAVEGRTFHSGALASLLPDTQRRAIAGSLVGLARKGLIAGDQQQYPGDDAFRFTHALIRDVAYAGVPKLLRADLHAGIASWLEARPAADEVVGYQLEQACRLRRELGYAGETDRGLAARAVEHLEVASHGALARGDPAAASGLLERAVAVAGSDETARGALLPALGASLFEAGRMTDATRVLDEAISGVSGRRLAARAQIEREFVRLEVVTGAHLQQSLSIADAVLPVLVREGDDYGQCRAWSLRAQVAWIGGRMADADVAWQEAAGCARRAGSERDVFGALGWRSAGRRVRSRPGGRGDRGVRRDRHARRAERGLGRVDAQRAGRRTRHEGGVRHGRGVPARGQCHARRGR